MFCKYTWWVKTVNIFYKELHLRCLAGFWICFCLTLEMGWFHKFIGSHLSVVGYSHPSEMIPQRLQTVSLRKIHMQDFSLDLKLTIVLKYWYCEKLDFNTELEEYFQIYILWDKNLSATMPAAPKVALPRRKLLQAPIIVLYLTKLVGASSGTFCEVQKLGGCCIGFRHWSKELPKFRQNGPIKENRIIDYWCTERKIININYTVLYCQ